MRAGERVLRGLLRGDIREEADHPPDAPVAIEEEVALGGDVDHRAVLARGRGSRAGRDRAWR